MNVLNMTEYLKYRDPRYLIMNLRGNELQEAIAKLSRQDIIDWLQWNDRDGIYTDEQSLKEPGNIMSREEGVEIMTRMIEEAQQLSMPCAVILRGIMQLIIWENDSLTMMTLHF